MELFAKRLKEIRDIKKEKDPKWTQGYVAERIGVARPTYTSYENGIKEPSLETLKSIADLLEISVDYLLGRIDSPMPFYGESRSEYYILGYGNKLTDDELEVARIAVEAYRRGKQSAKE